jgi:hypothetical protein
MKESDRRPPPRSGAEDGGTVGPEFWRVGSRILAVRRASEIGGGWLWALGNERRIAVGYPPSTIGQLWEPVIVWESEGVRRRIVGEGEVMAETKGSTEKNFPEWMVTQALGAHLGDGSNEHAERMGWFFNLGVQTPQGARKIRDLSGFSWETSEIGGGAEKSFKDGKGEDGDRGNIASDEFKKTYLTITPDFRYWTPKRDKRKQLIIEAKGTESPSGQRDRIQAERYFSYLHDSGYEGGLVYFVPNPQRWLAWLLDIAGASPVPFGVVDLKREIVPKVANELVHVVGKTLVQTADLLNAALRFSRRNS